MMLIKPDQIISLCVLEHTRFLLVCRFKKSNRWWIAVSLVLGHLLGAQLWQGSKQTEQSLINGLIFCGRKHISAKIHHQRHHNYYASVNGSLFCIALYYLVPCSRWPSVRSLHTCSRCHPGDWVPLWIHPSFLCQSIHHLHQNVPLSAGTSACTTKDTHTHEFFTRMV